MLTSEIPRRERQLEFYSRPRTEQYVPAFEPVAEGWPFEHIVALAVFSLLVHGALIGAVFAAIRLLPKNNAIVLTAQDLLNRDNLRYLDFAPDRQKPPERPKTNAISDKDRIKSTRKPSIDRKTLDELADNRRPGPPQLPGPAAATPVMPQQAQEQQAQAAGANRGGLTAPANQLAQLQPPALAGRAGQPQFGGALSAGSVIQQATRAAAAQRGGAGAAGDYGMGPAFANTNHRDDFEVLSDTLGVDFAPYIKRMRLQVYTNWMNLIPEAARPPLRKKGVVTIEFSVLKDGSVVGVRLVSTSGDISLDRAAYGAITASNLMGALPAEFRGDYFTVRGRFYYNPERNEMR